MRKSEVTQPGELSITKELNATLFSYAAGSISN